MGGCIKLTSLYVVLGRPIVALGASCAPDLDLCSDEQEETVPALPSVRCLHLVHGRNRSAESRIPFEPAHLLLCLLVERAG